MDEQLNELQTLAAQARTKKGRMDQASRLRAAELLASLWCEDPELARETPLLFDDLSSEAVADGVSKMWPSLSDERRSDFKRTLYKPTTERAIRRLALLVAAVINSDGSTAFEWLQVLLPREKQNVAKDVQQSLSSVLFTSPPLAFENLAGVHSGGLEVTRIFFALWEIAKSGPQGSSLMARARLAKAFARFALGQDGGNIQIRMFLSDLQEERNRWPAHLQELFDKELPEIQDRIAASAKMKVGTIGDAPYCAPTSPEPSAVQLSEHAAPHSEDPINEQVKKDGRSVADQAALAVAPPQIECLNLLERLTSNATLDLSLLNTLSEIIRMLTREKDSLADEIGIVRQRAHTAEANKRDQVMRLEQQLADSVATVAGLKSEVERTRERERSVTTQLANERDNATSEALRVKSEIVQMSSAWDTERGLLAKQIAANAAGRVDEFRKRLGSRLSRIAHDLPQKDTVMSLELGSAILLLFHQFVEALQEQDVPLTTGKNIQ